MITPQLSDFSLIVQLYSYNRVLYCVISVKGFLCRKPSSSFNFFYQKEFRIKQFDYRKVMRCREAYFVQTEPELYSHVKEIFL
jgi:hypothetical protein